MLQETKVVKRNGRTIKPDPLSADLKQALRALAEIRWALDSLEDRLLDIAVETTCGGADGRA
jgi:hypothetical protein